MHRKEVEADARFPKSPPSDFASIDEVEVLAADAARVDMCST